MQTNNQIINLLLLSAAAYSGTQKRAAQPKCCTNPKLRHISPYRIEVDDNNTAATDTNYNAGMNTNYNNGTNTNYNAGTNAAMTNAYNNNYNNGMNMMNSSNANMEDSSIDSRPNLLNALYAADNAVNMSPASTGPFELPPLEYDYDALEPYIDEKTLRTHHQRHHKTYVDNLNAALSRYPEFYNSTLDELLLFPDRLPSDIQTQITNNAGGHYNHMLTWKVIGPPNKSRPTGELADAIDRQFGSFENLRRNLKAAGESVFGSGYAWLVLNPYGRLLVITTQNQNTPIPLRMIPLLPVDVWEHAYYLKHQHRRGNYIDDLSSVINWDRVGDRFEAASQALNSNS